LLILSIIHTSKLLGHISIPLTIKKKKLEVGKKFVDREKEEAKQQKQQ
jgi:hypothetical protein